MDRLSESGAIAGSKELWTCRAAVAPPARTAPPRPDGRASLSPDPASPAARDPRGCSSPFPRRASLRRRLRPRENAATLLRGARACLALLAAAALLALAAPAQAQTEVWTATLTPGDLSSGILGCSNGVQTARCSSTSVLSGDSFNYDSTDYNITGLFVRSVGSFEFQVDADITTDTLAALTLVVGSTSLVLNAGTASGARTRIWDSSGVSLTAGTDIAVKLTAPVTNTAPTAANNTVATAQGTAYSFTAGDFGFDDADTGDTLASVKIVTPPALGTLALDGTAVLADAVVTKAQIDGDMLTFTPVAGASGAPYTTFTFKVNDGTDDSANAYTMTIDVTAVAAELPSAPATPIVSAVSGSSTSLSVSWAAPANAGKPPIDSYDVQYRVGNSGDWSDGPEDVTRTTATVIGLAADTDYEVRVRATNAEGNSGWSDPPGSGRTNANAPRAPRKFLKAVTSDRHVMLSWFAPARDGGSSISKYEYRHASGASVPDDTPWSSGTSYRLQAGFGSLINGQRYTFQVRAVGAEEGPAASVTATPSANPVRRRAGRGKRADGDSGGLRGRS